MSVASLVVLPCRRRSVAERLRVGSLVASVAFGLVPLTHFCCVAPRDEVDIFLPPLLKMFALCTRGRRSNFDAGRSP